MKLANAILDGDTNYHIEKIRKGHQFQLADYKKDIKAVISLGYTDWVMIMDFIHGCYTVIPNDMVKPPQKERQLLIRNKLVTSLQDIKTDFMTIDEVFSRIVKWQSIWPFEDFRYWTPTVVHYVEGKGFVWCNGRNRSVPNSMVELYENGYSEEQKAMKEVIVR